jgi:hypothetical protein
VADHLRILCGDSRSSEWGERDVEIEPQDYVSGAQFNIVNGKLPVDAVVLILVHSNVVLHQPSSLDQLDLALGHLDLLRV